MTAPGSGQPIRVALVDDHPMVIEVLAHTLARDAAFRVTGIANDVAGGLALVRQTPVDVLIADVSLGDKSGLDLIFAVHGEFPQIRVMVLSAYDERRIVRTALEAGATGYLLKTAQIAQIRDAVIAVAAGQVVIDPSIDMRGGDSGLSARQIEVLDCLYRGLSRRAMAEEMGISLNTVKTHVMSLYRALDVKTSLEALRKAEELGWRPPELADDETLRSGAGPP